MFFLRWLVGLLYWGSVASIVIRSVFDDNSNSEDDIEDWLCGAGQKINLSLEIILLFCQFSRL